jgi:iron complex outermembrane recepter protein
MAYSSHGFSSYCVTGGNSSAPFGRWKRILRRRRMTSSLLASAALFGMLSGQAAMAQAPSVTSDNTTSLDAIIVTAERRSERAQDVPITMTTLTSDQLKQADVQSLADIQSLTPALRFDSSGAYWEPTIRGVGSAVETSGAGSNVGIYIDGFYILNQQTLDFQLLNLESIQVLKGPQGTLFGQNTAGGAILVTTTKPSETTSGTIDLSYASYNAQRFQEYFTTGLLDNLAVDVAGTFSKGDGYVRDIVTGSDTDGAYQNWSIRTGVKFDPTDKISILFRYLHDDTNDPSTLMYSAYVSGGRPLAPGAVIPGTIVATQPNQVADANGTTFVNKSNAFQLTMSFDLDFATLTSYTQDRKDNSATVAEDYALTTFSAPACANAQAYCHLLGIGIPTEDRTTTQEFILSSDASKQFKWTAGLFYLDYKDHLSASLNQLGSAYAPVANNGTDTLAAAAYFDGTYRVLDDLYVTAGVRYSHDEVRDAYFKIPPVPTGGIQNLPTLTNNKVTPRAVVRYVLNDYSNVYFSFSRGFKAAIYNTGGDQTGTVQPESINAYEVGYKYAANALSFDLSSFYYDYTNLQVASYQSFPVPESVVQNAADSRIYGFEGQVQYQVTSSFSVGAGGAYTDAVYLRFNGSPTYTQCLNPATCGANLGFLTSGSTNLVDAPMQRAPKYTGNITARYATPLAGGSLAFSGNLYYTSKFYFDSSHEFFQGAYPLLGLRAEWTDQAKRYTIALYGDNVTDRKYLSQVLPENTGIAATWGHPATVGGELRYHFR